MNGSDEADERSFLAEMPMSASSAGIHKPAAVSSAKPSKSAPPPHYAGHRDRLRDRFAKSGADGLADYELLELVLFRSIPRADTKPLAKALLARFGSLGEVLGAPVNLLCEVKGVGQSVALDLKLVLAAAERGLRSEVAEREVFSSWQKVLDYCKAAMAYETREQFRILFLDKRNALIADEVQNVGTVDHTMAYPREVLRRALQLSATAVILAHNHPSGDPTPSRADIDMTKAIADALKPSGIAVHDHIIIGKKGYASMKGLLLI